MMLKNTYTITAENGLHARPATNLVNKATKYNSEINLEYNGKTVNLKSIMGILSLGVPRGAEVSIIISGSDEEQAMEAMTTTLKEQGLIE